MGKSAILRIEKAVALNTVVFSLTQSMGKVESATYTRPKPIRAHKATLVRALIWTFLRNILGRREQIKSVTRAKAVKF